jgi:hypothetical protein
MMKKTVVIVVAMGMLLAGCTGSFNVTRQVYGIHRSEQDRWLDEAIFVGSVLVQVYTISLLADTILFNSIEFWSGSNPIAPATGDNGKTASNGSRIAYHPGTDTVRIIPTGGEGDDVVLERTGTGVAARDTQGRLLFYATKDVHGGVAVFDGDAALVRRIPPEQVARARDLYAEGRRFTGPLL